MKEKVCCEVIYSILHRLLNYCHLSQWLVLLLKYPLVCSPFDCCHMVMVLMLNSPSSSTHHPWTAMLETSHSNADQNNLHCKCKKHTTTKNFKNQNRTAYNAIKKYCKKALRITRSRYTR